MGQPTYSQIAKALTLPHYHWIDLYAVLITVTLLQEGSLAGSVFEKYTNYLELIANPAFLDHHSTHYPACSRSTSNNPVLKGPHTVLLIHGWRLNAGTMAHVVFRCSKCSMDAIKYLIPIQLLRVH